MRKITLEGMSRGKWSFWLVSSFTRNRMEGRHFNILRDLKIIDLFSTSLEIRCKVLVIKLATVRKYDGNVFYDYFQNLRFAFYAKCKKGETDLIVFSQAGEANWKLTLQLRVESIQPLFFQKKKSDGSSLRKINSNFY